jgi:hypothetical protein
MPVKTPVVGSTEPIVSVLVLHMPPDTVLVRVLVEPAHTVVLPMIEDGDGSTVMVVVAIAGPLHPVTE